MVETLNKPKPLGAPNQTLAGCEANILEIDYSKPLLSEDYKSMINMRVALRISKNFDVYALMDEISAIDGVAEAEKIL